MALHGGDHLRADKVAHELRAGAGESCSQQAKGDGDKQRCRDIANLALEDRRIFIAQKEEKRAVDWSCGRNR